MICAELLVNKNLDFVCKCFSCLKYVWEIPQVARTQTLNTVLDQQLVEPVRLQNQSVETLPSEIKLKQERKLRDGLSEVVNLGSLLPICALCLCTWN